MSSYMNDSSSAGVMKRRVSKEPSSNFRAGYVHIDEEHLHKTGIRGRKVYFVFAITVALTLIAIVNILITFTILVTLRLGYAGLESLEFTPGGHLLRFLGETYIGGEVLLIPGDILSLPDREITITGQKNKVHLTVSDTNSTFSLGPYHTKLRTDRFDVIDPESGKIVFSTDFSQFRFPDEMNSILLQDTQTNRVTSDVDQDLRLEAESNATLRGTEGVSAASREVTLNARKGLVLNSTNSTLNLEGREGPYLSQIRDFAKVNSSEPLDTDVLSHKICVCMPSGKLFAVPATRRCDQANENQNPCL